MPARTFTNDFPRIATTTVGSYPVPNWLLSSPSEQSIKDATRVIVDIQRHCGIELPTDGELYRFDINHPETNGMIDYFIRPLAGVRSEIGRADSAEFAQKSSMSFRTRPAGVVEGPLGEGALNLVSDCDRAVSVAGKGIKFTVTSPYMLARTLLDHYYRDFETLTMHLAEVIAQQLGELTCASVQIDEANIPGNPKDAPLALKAINLMLDQIKGQRAVHFCFGNYDGQSVQKGTWSALVDFLSGLHCDHLVLELAHRPSTDLPALREISSDIKLGIGVIDVKVNHIETPDEVAARIEEAEKVIGPDRIGWVHPDCGFWMLKRTVADRKMESLVKGRNKYLGM